jgi:GLPGLI family protein
MNRSLITIIILLLISPMASGQFVTKGKIEYERKTNQHAFMDESNTWDEMAKKNLPKFVTSYFDLSFDNRLSTYKPGRYPEARPMRFWGIADVDNMISTNLDSNTSVTQKNIYGDLYLITDSVRKINWKITNEFRNIAGFDCRKAVGKVMDSIIVIAFYTDEIITPGGPESFAGLPGMILGVAIPRMHTTWYATKLQLAAISDKDFEIPKKGKKYSGPEFRTRLQELLKDWGERSYILQWQIAL